MFSELKPNRSYSFIGLAALIGSLVGMIALSIADGLIRGYAVQHMASSDSLTTWTTWIVDFRYCFENGIWAATVFFIGAKFLETRTVLSVSFDRLDAKRIAVRGPDENNVVWIGRKFESPLEAQAVADTLAERLKQSAT